MKADQLPFFKSLSTWLHTRGTQHDAAMPEILTLAGDGSSRIFFRMQVGQESFVVLYDKTWTASQDYPSHQEFLKSRKLPVPEFHHVNPKDGFLIMQDLGDELLQHRIQKSPSSRMELLWNAASLLAHFHGSTFPPPEDLPANQRSFDETKLSQELNYTLEHLHGRYLGLPAPKDSGKIISDYTRMIEKLVPKVVCHRDYHARNILYFKDQLVLIDFQDARMGPPEYDLASLIYDPYVNLNEDDRIELIASYTETLSDYPELFKLWEGERETLMLVGLQRIVKAAGSFSAFFNLQGKSTHLQYLVPALTTALSLRAELGSKLSKSFDDIFPIETWLREVRKK